MLIRPFFFAAVLLSSSALAAPSLLPQPAKLEVLHGNFAIDGKTVIVAPQGDAGAKAAALQFAEMVVRTRGTVLPVTQKARAKAIRFNRVSGLSEEAYRLDVTAKSVVISATTDAGLFYGAVSLWQLMTDGTGPIPALHIEDAPRFPWRGMMLDSARHFQSPAFVKQLIDWMAAHKLNRLHWHLVDDQGWRIEIRKYPKLTETSAWRIPASAPGAPPLPRTGGFYTQNEIREIVAYAAARHITIMPEIEMPGHALSAIRAYPELGTGAPVPPGVESDWGVFPWLYNVDNSTFGFLEDVLDEVLALFPSRYIHVGGDEAMKDQWKASARIQAQMKVLGLKDEHALQSWFIRRIERYLNAHSRNLVGWDEILDGGLAPNATVMSWRGIDGAVAAARAGHDAILSPSPDLYLDHVQADGPGEPPGRGGAITLGSVYAFDPEPRSIPPEQRRHILGLQGNLWTEHVRTEERAAYMAFPRMSALAEIAWSQSGKRDLGAFADRLVPQLERLKPMGLDAADSAFTPQAVARLEDGKAKVALSNQIGSDIRYTLDGRAPSAQSPRYTTPLVLPLPSHVRAVAFRGTRALPGSLDTVYDARTIRRRSDNELKLCSNNVALQLEDDAPANGPRAAFLIDIMNPCWIYEQAPMDGVTAIEIDAGQIPFNFQIGADIGKIAFRPPATPEGEIEVRIDSCEGERIAVLPLAPAARNPAITRLSAPVAKRSGTYDLCFTYTAKGVNPLWAIDAVQLVQGS